MNAPVVVISDESEDDPLRVEANAGTWTTAWSSAADTFVDAVAGIGAAQPWSPGVAAAALRVLVDGTELSSDSPADRRKARLAVVTSRLPALVGLRVVDVVQLGVGGDAPPLWQTLLGTTRARRGAHDDEAAARALGGRIGLGRWLDVEAVHLPPAVAALADVARGVVGQPRALVWRHPEWLSPDDVEALIEIIEDEQDRIGFAVVEVRQRMRENPAQSTHGEDGTSG